MVANFRAQVGAFWAITRIEEEKEYLSHTCADEDVSAVPMNLPRMLNDLWMNLFVRLSFTYTFVVVNNPNAKRCNLNTTRLP